MLPTFQLIRYRETLRTLSYGGYETNQMMQMMGQFESAGFYDVVCRLIPCQYIKRVSRDEKPS
jgi:hypothetical protein